MQRDQWKSTDILQWLSDNYTKLYYSYDGNTVTALWNYAQHFAMSDNSFSSTFGPSTPGALNLIYSRKLLTYLQIRKHL